MVRFALIVDGEGAETFLRSVFVLKASTWEEAKTRAIDLGRRREDDFRNADGKRVVLRLIEVETLDMLSSDELEGVEVYSEPVPAGDEGLNLTVEATFFPEQSVPTQTGIS